MQKYPPVFKGFTIHNEYEKKPERDYPDEIIYSFELDSNFYIRCFDIKAGTNITTDTLKLSSIINEFNGCIFLGALKDSNHNISDFSNYRPPKIGDSKIYVLLQNGKAGSKPKPLEGNLKSIRYLITHDNYQHAETDIIEDLDKVINFCVIDQKNERFFIPGLNTEDMNCFNYIDIFDNHNQLPKQLMMPKIPDVDESNIHTVFDWEKALTQVLKSFTIDLWRKEDIIVELDNSELSGLPKKAAEVTLEYLKKVYDSIFDDLILDAANVIMTAIKKKTSGLKRSIDIDIGDSLKDN